MIADTPVAAPVRSTPEFIVQCLTLWDAQLKRKPTDNATGAMRVEIFKRAFAHMAQEQVKFMSHQVIMRMKFFPTVAECLEIASEWRSEAKAEQERAKALVVREMQLRFEAVVTRLKRGEVDQAEVDGLSDHWKRLLETRSLLRLMPDGSYVARPPIKIDDDDLHTTTENQSNDTDAQR